MSVTIKTKSNASDYRAGTGVEISANGQSLSGIAAADIRIRPDEVVTADLEVALYDVSVVAQPRWLAVNPETGFAEEVRRIEFANGDVWEAP